MPANARIGSRTHECQADRHGPLTYGIGRNLSVARQVLQWAGTASLLLRPESELQAANGGCSDDNHATKVTD